MPARAATPEIPRPSQPTSSPAAAAPEASVTVTPCRTPSCATTVSPDSREARRGLHRGKEGGVKVPVLQHEAHRAFLDLGGIEGRKNGAAPRPPARPMAGSSGSAAPCRRPAPRRRSPSTAGPRRWPAHRPARRTPLRPGPGGAGVDHRHAEPALRQRQGQGGAVQPAARDQDVGVPCHAPFIARTRDCPCVAKPLPLRRKWGTDERNLGHMTAADLGREIGKGASTRSN
jgi:hypothetical protein